MLFCGGAGAVLGAIPTAIYVSTTHHALAIRLSAWCGEMGASVVFGDHRALSPAKRAARRFPTEAPWTI